jgi:hypothetical protein
MKLKLFLFILVSISSKKEQMFCLNQFNDIIDIKPEKDFINSCFGKKDDNLPYVETNFLSYNFKEFKLHFPICNVIEVCIWRNSKYESSPLFQIILKENVNSNELFTKLINFQNFIVNDKVNEHKEGIEEVLLKNLSSCKARKRFKK